MTQTFDDTENDDLNDDGEGTVGILRKQLREANKRAKDAEERAEANSTAAKRVAFQDAGIPDNPQTKFFREHYSGDMTAEAIKASASEYGFIVDADHSDELKDVAAQSEASFGAEGPTVLGSQEEMEAEMDKAARNAPRGQETRAIQEVVERFTRSA